MKNAGIKDIWRTIRNERKRFISLLVITALGVIMVTGLKATCVDLRLSADRFFDNQQLFDLSIQSTLGLTEQDVLALKNVQGVQRAEGAYSETVYVMTSGKKQTTAVKTISQSGINEPYVLEGSLPAAANEIAVTKSYITSSGKAIGDTLTLIEDLHKGESKDTDSGEEDLDIFTEEEVHNFPNTEFVITAIVVDPMDINSSEGAASFRSTATTDFVFFVLPEAVDSDIYTAVYLLLDGTSPLMSYSEDYIKQVETIQDSIETTIKESREESRTDEVRSEAIKRLNDAIVDINEHFSEAEAELNDARQQLEEGWQQWKDGSKELDIQEQAAKSKLEDAKQQLEEGYAQIIAGETELETAVKSLEDGATQVKAARLALENSQADSIAKLNAAQQQMNEQRDKLSASIAQAEAGVSASIMLIGEENWPAQEWQAYVEAAKTGSNLQVAENAFMKKLNIAIENRRAEWNEELQSSDEETAAILAGKLAALDSLPGTLKELANGLGQAMAGMETLNAKQSELSAQRANMESQFAQGFQAISEKEQEIEQGRLVLERNREQLKDARLKLDVGAEELAKQEKDALIKLAEAKEDLAEGRKELEEGQIELEDGEAELREKRQEAEEAIIDARKQIDEIDTATWYVQNRNSLSGYANVNSDSDAIESIGTVFPIVFLLVAVLISLTTITRMVEEERGLIGTYKALGFTDREIRRKYLIYAGTASLIGGLIGDFGGFVLLPKFVFTIFSIMYQIPSYQLSFDAFTGFGGVLLFVVAILGATLLACRAELNQTPAALMRPSAPRAGASIFLEHWHWLWNRLSFLNKVTARNLFRYKKRLLMTVGGIMGCTALLVCGFAIKDSVRELMPRQYEQVYNYDLLAVASPNDNSSLVDYLDGNDSIDSYLNVYITNVKATGTSGDSETVQLIVVPNEETLAGYIQLQNIEGDIANLEDSGILVTRNLSIILDFMSGDTISVQDMELHQKDVMVSGIVENYLGNTIYMTQSLYEQLFGTWEANGVLANISDSCKDPVALSDWLAEQEGVTSVVSTNELKEEFSSAFAMINMVVFIIIFMAASLALVVLFTLSNTNISERIRELSTIKVLGFYDREVHLYVNKETLILTGIGILLGLPAGGVLGSLLTQALKMPSVYFAVTIYPISYLLSAGLAFGFAVMVSMLTNKTLDRVNPIEALKSVE